MGLLPSCAHIQHVSSNRKLYLHILSGLAMNTSPWFMDLQLEEIVCFSGESVRRFNYYFASAAHDTHNALTALGIQNFNRLAKVAILKRDAGGNYL